MFIPIIRTIVSLLLCQYAAVATAVIPMNVDERILKDFQSLDVQNVNIHASPECWIGALRGLRGLQRGKLDSNERSSDVSGSLVCDAMTYEQQQILGLELTKCHMESAGRQLFVSGDSIEAYEMCTSRDLIELPNRLRFCLSSLSDVSHGIYTSFFLLVNQICTRLTDEYMISRKHEVEIRLIESSLAVSAQLAEMRFQQTELIGRFQDQVSMHEEALDKIIQQQLGLEAMSKVIHASSKATMPLIGMDAIVSKILVGYTWLKYIMYQIMCTNVVWLTTMHWRARGARRNTMILLFVMGAIEGILFYLKHQKMVSDSNVDGVVPIIRMCSALVSLLLFMFSIIRSIVFGSKEDPHQVLKTRDLQMYQTQILQELQKEFVKERNHPSLFEEEQKQVAKHQRIMTQPTYSSPGFSQLQPSFFLSDHEDGHRLSHNGSISRNEQYFRAYREGDLAPEETLQNATHSSMSVSKSTINNVGVEHEVTPPNVRSVVTPLAVIHNKEAFPAATNINDFDAKADGHEQELSATKRRHSKTGDDSSNIMNIFKRKKLN